jgi:hypothetical protein
MSQITKHILIKLCQQYTLKSCGEFNFGAYLPTITPTLQHAKMKCNIFIQELQMPLNKILIKTSKFYFRHFSLQYIHLKII